MPSPAIEIHELRKEFNPRRLLRRGSAPPRVAIDHLSLVVPRGQRLAILGPNGAGKSTLLRILATLVRPTAGRVHVEGISIQNPAAVQPLIGWATGDERSFYWPLSGFANLEFFASMQNLHGAAARERIALVLDQVGLADAAKVAYHAYSSGMRQRLAVARALLHAPHILLLDEPTRSLDPESADGLRHLLRACGQQGQTIIWVTHNPDEAAGFCDRVIWMRNGRIVADHSTADGELAVRIPWKETSQ
jgi:ABC-2 type transport system ATP-binding protein